MIYKQGAREDLTGSTLRQQVFALKGNNPKTEKKKTENLIIIIVCYFIRAF